MWDMDGRAAYFTSLVIASQSVKFESTFLNNCSSYLFPLPPKWRLRVRRIADLAGGVRGKAKKRKGAKITIEVFINKIIFLAKITAFRKQKRNRAIKKILSKAALFCFNREKDLYNTKIKNPLERHRPHSLVTCFWTIHDSWGAFTLGVTLCLGKL